MSNDEKKFQPIFQVLHIKSTWFLLELAMALVTTIGMRFLQVCSGFFLFHSCENMSTFIMLQGWVDFNDYPGLHQKSKCAQ